MQEDDEPPLPVVAPPTLPGWAAQFVEVKGLKTRFYQAGQGPPLLLIPSVFLRAASYRNTIFTLAEHFQVIAAEMPGSGRSARLRRPWGFAQGADWVADFMDVLELERAIVVGHSDTGGTATLMGVRHPDRLDALVIADSVGARPGITWPALLWGRFLDGTFEESRLNLPLTPHIIANLFRHTRSVLHHAFKLAVDPLPLEMAPQVGAPTLIAWGRRDHTFPPDCAERLQQAIPDSRIVWSDASHDWIITHPRAFADAVVQFKGELKARKGECQATCV